MNSATEVASDLVQATGALAGLILVYIGAVVAGFDSYDAQQQKSIKGRYQLRAWLAFVGFVISLLSCCAAIFGKWLKIECLAVAAIVLAVIGFLWVIVVAVATVREIK